MLQAEQKRLRYKDQQRREKILLLTTDDSKSGSKLLVKAKAKQEKPADRTAEQLR